MISPHDRICVVGGGPGGVGTAWYLERAGFTNVTVLEMLPQVGGKARTIDVDGNLIDLGALDVASDYVRVRRLAEEVDAPMRESAPLGLIDYAAGTVRSSIGGLTSGTGKLRLLRDLLRYLRATGWTYDGYLEAPGMAATPDALAVPMGQWLDGNGLSALRPMFDYACTNFGYGPLDEIPAAYLMRFVDWGLFTEMLELDLGWRRWPRVFVKGYGNLFIMVAQRLSDVRTGVHVERVTRHPGTDDPVRVSVRGEAETLGFDHLIMACRLDGELSRIIPDLSPEAKALLAKVKYQPYTTTVCRVRGMPLMALGAIPVAPDGHALCMIQPWTGGDACAFYVMNREGATPDRIHENIRADMASLRTLDGKPCRFEVHDMVEHVAWDYFPHVSSEDLAAGFYDRLDMLQGESRTYFVGGLLGFETVHNTLGVAESIVQRFFLPA